MRACVAAALQHAPFVHHGGAAGRPVHLMGIGAGLKLVLGAAFRGAANIGNCIGFQFLWTGKQAPINMKTSMGGLLS